MGGGDERRSSSNRSSTSKSSKSTTVEGVELVRVVRVLYGKVIRKQELMCVFAQTDTNQFKKKIET